MFSGAGGQRLWAGGGLVGFGRGDVRDDVWPPAVLQPGPREAVRAHPHGRDQVPTNSVGRRQVAAVRAAHQGPQQTVHTQTHTYKTHTISRLYNNRQGWHCAEKGRYFQWRHLSFPEWLQDALNLNFSAFFCIFGGLFMPISHYIQCNRELTGNEKREWVDDDYMVSV